MRHWPWLLFCLSCMAAGSNAMPWRHSKRKPSDSALETDQERAGSSFLSQKGAAAAAELKRTLRTLSRHLTLRSPSLVFHMDQEEERNLLIDALWRGDFVTTLGRFTRMNPDIVSIFENPSLSTPTTSQSSQVLGRVHANGWPPFMNGWPPATPFSGHSESPVSFLGNTLSVRPILSRMPRSPLSPFKPHATLATLARAADARCQPQAFAALGQDTSFSALGPHTALGAVRAAGP